MRDIFLTDSIISIKNQLFYPKTGAWLNEWECFGVVGLKSNIILLEHEEKKDGTKRTQLLLEANPGSRELDIGRTMAVESVHIVSKDLLLIQSKENEWTMKTTVGIGQQLPSELEQLL